MGTLKRIGAILLNVTSVLAFGEPILKKFLPGKAGEVLDKVNSELLEAAKIVTTSEVMIGAISAPDAKTGAQKLQAARPFMVQLIQSSEIMVGMKIRNEADFLKAVDTITGGVADLMNALEKK